MPAPLRLVSMCSSAFHPDLECKERAEPIPPEPDSFVTDIYTAFMKQIFHVAERERKADVHHHCKANNLGQGFEIAERIFHQQSLRGVQPGLKLFSSDSATTPSTFNAISFPERHYANFVAKR